MSSGRKLGACHSFVDLGGVAVVVLGIFTSLSRIWISFWGVLEVSIPDLTVPVCGYGRK